MLICQMPSVSDNYTSDNYTVFNMGHTITLPLFAILDDDRLDMFNFRFQIGSAKISVFREQDGLRDDQYSGTNITEQCVS